MLASLNLPRMMPCDVATRWNSTHVRFVKTIALRQYHISSSAEQTLEVPVPVAGRLDEGRCILSQGQTLTRGAFIITVHVAVHPFTSYSTSPNATRNFQRF